MAGFMGSGLSPSQFDFAHLFLSYMHCKSDSYLLLLSLVSKGTKTV